MSDRTEFSIGIDLGTSSASIGFYDHLAKNIDLIKVDCNEEVFPSFISLGELESKGIILLGNQAKDHPDERF